MGEIFGYVFQNKVLLEEALTHPSYGHEFQVADNQRLEFLGDAVLGLVIAQMLFDVYAQSPEGDLSAFRARLVNRERLADIAEQMGVDLKLRLGNGEDALLGRGRKSTLADAFEAVIGAIYLDGGYVAVHRVVSDIYRPLVDVVQLADAEINYKGRLQELAQRLSAQIPRYKTIKETGPEHEKMFTVEVLLGQDIKIRGTGMSKKEAQQEAARLALDYLEQKGDEA